MNRLKIDKLTKARLVGPIYNLLKGTCQSSIELEYNMEECYKALSDQLDWKNPKKHRCPFDLSKPLPLKGLPDAEKKYTTSITKRKAARYELVGIEDMIPSLWSVTKVGYDKDAEQGIKHWGPMRQLFYSVVSVKVNKLHGYGHLEEIIVRRADRQLYTFKEGNFVDLHLNDIEDMLLLVVQHKLFQLDISDIVDLVVALRKINGRMMLESIENGPLVYPTIEENGKIRKKKYAELTEQEQLQDDCDVQATNIILQGTELSYQEHECKLYNEFDKFTSVKGESLYEYYLRFAKLINDMHTIGMTMQQLAKNMYNTNYDQMYAYLSQHEGHSNEARILRERFLDPLALVANYQTQSNSAQGNNAAGQAKVVKFYNYQSEGHMERQCTQPKRPRNSAWFKEKMLLVQRSIQFGTHTDPGIAHSQATQTTIPQNDAYQTDDLDAYDSDCDDISSAKAVLMANLSSYDSDILSEYHNMTLIKMMIRLIKINLGNKLVNEFLTAELERYKERVKTFEQRLNIDLSSRENFIDLQMDDMILNRNALKQEIDSLKHTLSKHVKEKESLLQTFTVFKKES
ncbi:hypothetical protein Tco_1185107 [Tanacetum coccineum]